MISPSPGMNSPAFTMHDIALAQARRRHCLDASPAEPVRHGLGLAPYAASSACALPRPSAIASAKFANSTVNQSQNATWPGEQRLAGAAGQLLDEDDRREEAADLDDEHHRILDLNPRIELPERIDDRLPDDAGIPDRNFACAF